MAPLLVLCASLGTIYEGVSFFITGGNVVAVAPISFDVFNKQVNCCG